MTRTGAHTYRHSHMCTDTVHVDKHTWIHMQQIIRDCTHRLKHVQNHTHVLPPHVSLGAPLPPRIAPACCYSRLLLQ